MAFIDDEEPFLNNDYFNESSISEHDIKVPEVLLSDLRTWAIETTYGDHHYIVNVTTFIACILGYLTHTLNIIVLSKTQLPNSLHVFLIGLSVTEILQSTSLIIEAAHYFNGFKLFPFYEFVVMVWGQMFIDCIFKLLLNWLAAVIGIWRCVGITWPLQSLQLCSPCRATVTMIVILVISIISSVPYFVLFKCGVQEMGSILVYHLELAGPDSSMRSLKIYDIFKQLIYFLQMILILVSIIWIGVSFRKTGIEREIKLDQQISRPNNHKISIMLIILLFCYLLSSILEIAYQFISIIYVHESMHLEEVRHVIEMMHTVRNVSILFLMIKSSVPLLIYYVLVEDFRRTFRRIFCRCIIAREMNFNCRRSESMLLEATNLIEGSDRQSSVSPIQCSQGNEAVELETY